MPELVLAVFFVLLGLVSATAQSTYLIFGTDDYQLLHRCEVLSGSINDTAFLVGGNVYRSAAVAMADKVLADKKIKLSGVDKKSLHGLISENGEWPYGTDRSENSRRSLWHTFYTKKYDLINAQKNGFMLIVNPVIDLMATVDQETPGNTSKKPLLLNTHGAEARGRITDKVGFYTLLTDNQENTPAFITNYKVNNQRVLPGRDYFTNFSGAGNSDYFYSAGYLDVAALHNVVHINFGNGKNFIGDGIRSLFLSDNAANTTYLQVNADYHRWHYQNLYLELTPQFLNLNSQLPHTMAALHYLEFRAAKWASLGLFEATVFNTPDCFHVGYLNPVIFSRLAGQYGSVPGKEMAGASFKVIAARRLELYGQLVIDDPGQPGPKGTKFGMQDKYGFQVGGRIIDAFALKNFDLQGELNVVRPFTYASTDSLVNYSNYNQPLADPLGSGFAEFIGIARYQPAQKLVITLRGMYYRRGANPVSPAGNWGNDIFQPTENFNATAPLISGIETSCKMASANISLQVFPNVFFDMGGGKRDFTAGSPLTILTSDGPTKGSLSSTWVYFGFRMNAPRRSYDAWY